MMPWDTIITSVVGGVTQLADDLITTDEEKRKLDIEEKKIDAALLVGQIETNKAEAAHASIFVAGWRPAVGWVAALSLALAFVPKSLVLTVLWAYQAWAVVSGWTVGSPVPALPVFPDVGVTEMIGLLTAMLGMGALRSFDKSKGVDTSLVESAKRIRERSMP